MSQEAQGKKTIPTGEWPEDALSDADLDTVSGGGGNVFLYWNRIDTVDGEKILD